MFPLQSPEREDFCSWAWELRAWVGWGSGSPQAQPSIKLLNLKIPRLQAESSNLKQQCNLVTWALIKQLGEFLLSKRLKPMLLQVCACLSHGFPSPVAPPHTQHTHTYHTTHSHTCRTCNMALPEWMPPLTPILQGTSGLDIPHTQLL